MDPKELRGLYEAYSEVYAPQENIEEGLRSAVQRLLGRKKQEPETKKPLSRGEFLRQKYNVGPDRSDTSAKRKILDRSKANVARAQRQVDIGNASQSYADAASDAHNRYLRAGYSKYGANEPVSGGEGGSSGRGGGHRAAGRAAALNREEFNWIVNTLLDEGYDLSSYTYDEFYGMCIEEVQQLNELTAATDKNVERVLRRRERRFNRSVDSGAPNKEFYQLRRSHRLAANRNERTGSNVSVDSNLTRESYDIYDTILSHLLDEGYAETPEAAEAIMVNMSEEWRQSIVESGYRGNSGGPEPTTVPSKPEIDPNVKPGSPKGKTYGGRQSDMKPGAQPA